MSGYRLTGQTRTALSVSLTGDLITEERQRFHILLLDRAGLEGLGASGQFAYLWADRKSEERYRPAPAYGYSSVREPIVVTRTARGRYSVEFEGMPVGGVAHVSAYGMQNRAECQLTNISRQVFRPLRVGVACFGPTGFPTDSQFTLAWAK